MFNHLAGIASNFNILMERCVSPEANVMRNVHTLSLSQASAVQEQKQKDGTCPCGQNVNSQES
jgi:hypothetical protein